MEFINPWNVEGAFNIRKAKRHDQKLIMAFMSSK
jgi:hypothetical protein